MKCVEISASACISDWWGIEGIILTQWRYSVKDINQISVTFYCLCPIIFSITSAVMLVRPYDASFKTLSFRDFCILSSFFFVFWAIHHQHLFLLFTHSLVWVHLFGTYCFLIVMSSCSVSLSSGERMNQPSWLPVKDFSRHLRIVFNHSISHDLHFRRSFTQQWTNCTLRAREHHTSHSVINRQYLCQYGMSHLIKCSLTCCQSLTSFNRESNHIMNIQHW